YYAHGSDVVFGFQQIVGREWIARDEYRVQRSFGYVSIAHYYHVLPGPVLSHGLKRIDSQRNEPQRFTGRLEGPACDGQDAAVRQMFQIIAKGIGGVKIVFGKGECAGGSGGPG